MVHARRAATGTAWIDEPPARNAGRTGRRHLDAGTGATDSAHTTGQAPSMAADPATEAAAGTARRCTGHKRARTILKATNPQATGSARAARREPADTQHGRRALRHHRPTAWAYSTQPPPPSAHAQPAPTARNNPAPRVGIKRPCRVAASAQRTEANGAQQITGRGSFLVFVPCGWQARRIWLAFGVATMATQSATYGAA